MSDRGVLAGTLSDPEMRLLARSLLGADSAERVSHWIDQRVRASFGKRLDRITLAEISIGAVFGVEVAGREVALKVYPKDMPRRFIEAVLGAQQKLCDAGFPAPRVLSRLERNGKIAYAFQECIRGKEEDAHQPRIRQEMARVLALFARAAQGITPIENPLQQFPRRTLWPKPHNAAFRYDGTGRGAAWIADRARRARKILNASRLPKMLAYTDWRVKNVAIRGGRLVAVYDWDSLGALSEAEVVGRAAAQFTANWELGVPVAPSPTEARRFFSEYERFRGRRFTQEERRVACAAADYIACIIARQEHARGFEEVRGDFRSLLRVCGEGSVLSLR